MTNGVFKDDAERDKNILESSLSLREMKSDITEIKDILKEIQTTFSRELQCLKTDNVYLKVWVGILSAVFIPLVIYLFQKALK